jgi:molecular chaperone GrpE (heat shock protein)
MSFKVTLYDPKTAKGLASYINLKATTSYINLKATTSYTKGSFSVSYPKITATSIDLGFYIISRLFTDASIFTDSISFITNKNLVDEVSIYDALAISIEKGVVDQTAATDRFTLSLATAYSETLSMQDATQLAYEKNVADIDQDVAVVLDAIDKFEISYNLADTVNATDDFDGATSIEDDQTMRFIKVVKNVASVSESLSRVVDYVRQFDDPAAALDAHVYEVSKKLADAASVADTVAILTVYQRILADAFSAQDSVTLSVDKIVEDSSTTTDYNVNSVGKNNLDPVGITDAGSMIWQGYVDNLYYFAEDYVGGRQLF